MTHSLFFCLFFAYVVFACLVFVLFGFPAFQESELLFLVALLFTVFCVNAIKLAEKYMFTISRHDEAVVGFFVKRDSCCFLRSEEIFHHRLHFRDAHWLIVGCLDWSAAPHVPLTNVSDVGFQQTLYNFNFVIAEGLV